MKKFMKFFVVALAVALFAVCFAGCSKASAVKKAYEKEGYTVTEATVKDNDEAKSALKTIGMSDDEIADAEDWSIIVASKSVSVAIILKVSSTKDLKDALTDDNGDSSAYDTLEDKGYINGDCVLIVGQLLTGDIFKNA